MFQLLSPFVVVYTTSAKWTGMQAKKHGFVLRRSQVTVCSKGWIQQLHKVQGQGFRKHYVSILRTIDTDTRSAPHQLSSINSGCCYSCYNSYFGNHAFKLFELNVLICFVHFFATEEGPFGPKRFAKWSCLQSVLRSRTNNNLYTDVVTKLYSIKLFEVCINIICIYLLYLHTAW